MFAHVHVRIHLAYSSICLYGFMCNEGISANPSRLKCNDLTVLSGENTHSFYMLRKRKTGKDISVQECSGYDFLLSLLLIPNLRGKLSI